MGVSELGCKNVDWIYLAQEILDCTGNFTRRQNSDEKYHQKLTQ